MAASSNKRYLVTAILLTAVILGSSLGFALVNILNTPGAIPGIVTVNAQASGKIMTTLKIEVFDSNGVLKETREKKDDLLLNNMIQFVYGFCIPIADQVSPQTLAFYDDSGTSRNFNVRQSSTITNTVGDSATGSARKGGFIGIGTGVTAPARTDNALVTKVESYTAVTSTYPTWTTATGFINIPSQIAITGTRNITEACLGVYWIDSGGTLRNVLMFRDTFAAIAVVNLDVVAVTYTIDLQNTSFLDNFANYFGGIFENIADGGASTVLIGNKRSDTGAAIASYSYSSTVSSTRPNYAYSGSYQSFVVIGTANTAVTRGDFKVNTPVETSTVPTVQINTTASTITITADVPCGSARTVREAGFYTYGGSGSYNWCLIRVTFADVSVSAGGTIRIKLVINL